MVEMMTVNTHLNSVISTKGAHYCTIDLMDLWRYYALAIVGTLRCVCVCVNSTSGGGRTLATPA